MDTAENRYIEITNKSDNDVYCFFSNQELSLDEYVNRTKFSREFYELIKKDSLVELDIVRPRWEEYIHKANDKKLKIYVIRKDSVELYGWKKIFEMDKYSKKINVTINELDSLNWKITYNDK